MSAAAAPSSSPKEGNKDSASAAAKSTLSVLKQLRAGSSGFTDFYGKVWNQISGQKPSYGILDIPTGFIRHLVLIVVGSIFLNDCQAEPMLPIFLIVDGVVCVSIQIVDQIAGSLLKDGNTTWKEARKICFTLIGLFLFGWFITGCVSMFRMPLPNMNRLPDADDAIRSIPGLMNDLMMSPTTNMVLKDQLTSMNDTMVAFLSPEKHCAYPVYGLSVWIIIFTLTKFGGYFVIVTVTTIVLYLSVEVENVKNMELLQMNNV